MVLFAWTGNTRTTQDHGLGYAGRRCPGLRLIAAYKKYTRTPATNLLYLHHFSLVGFCHNPSVIWVSVVTHIGSDMASDGGIIFKTWLIYRPNISTNRWTLSSFVLFGPWLRIRGRYIRRNIGHSARGRQSVMRVGPSCRTCPSVRTRFWIGHEAMFWA